MSSLASVYQEFYCAESGGGCGGYITVRLNMALNGVVEVICPNCDHKHQRMLKDGALKEQGRHTDKPTQELMPTIAAWSKEPKHPESKRSREDGWNHERDAQVIPEMTLVDSDKSRGKGIRPFLSDLWHERFGGR